MKVKTLPVTSRVAIINVTQIKPETGGKKAAVPTAGIMAMISFVKFPASCGG